MPATRGSGYQEGPSLQERILSFKQTATFSFSNDVLLSILLCLLSGDRHMIVTAPPPLMPELRTMVEQLCVHAFGLQTVVAPCDHTTSPAEFVSGLFYFNNFSGDDSGSVRSACTSQDPSEHLFGATETPIPNPSSASYTHQRHQSTLQPNRGRIRPTVSLTFLNNSNEFEPERFEDEENFTAYRRRRGKKNLTQDNDQISDVRRTAHVKGNAFNKNEEEFLAAITGNVDSPTARRRHTHAGPSDASPATSQRNFNNLTLNLPLTRPASHSRQTTSSLSRGRNCSTPQSPSPVSPVNFNISSQTRNQSLASLDRSVTTVGKKLPHAVILEGIADSSEAIQGALLEILVRRQLTDRGIVINCPRPFIVIALVPSFDRLHKVPLFLVDRFYICYDFKSRNGIVPAPSPPGIGDLHKLVQPDEMSNLGQLIVEVTIHHDIMRYIRDIVVALRTHRHVQRGVTGKATVDLQLAVR